MNLKAGRGSGSPPKEMILSFGTTTEKKKTKLKKKKK